MTEGSVRTIVLLSSDEAFVERVSSALYPHFQIIHGVPDSDDVGRLIASCNPAACLVDIDGTSWDRSPGVAMIAVIRGQWEHLPIIFATLDLSSATLVPAFRTGANDVCDKDFAPDELLAQIDRQANRNPARMGQEAARLIAFVGARSGQGTTTVALAATQDLSGRYHAGDRVLLLDFSHPPAIVPDLVGMRASYYMTDAVHDLSRLDDTMIEGAILRAPPGNLSILPLASTERGLGTLDPDDLMKLLAVLRSYFSLVIVDIAWPWRTQLTERLFVSADHRFMCVTQSVTSVHAASSFLNQVRETTTNDLPCDLIVTRHDPALMPNATEIGTALGVSATGVFVIPEARREIDLARNAADPLVRGSGRTAFQKSIIQISDSITGDPSAASSRLAGWRRLLKRSGRPDNVTTKVD